MRIICSLVVCSVLTLQVGADDSSSARLFPPSTLAYAELSDPSDLVSTIFDHPLRKRIESMEPYKMAIKSPEYRRFQFGRVFLEGHFAKNWREIIATFAANGVAIGFDAESQGVAIVIHGKDADAMKLLRDKLIELASFNIDLDVQSGQYRDITAYQVDETKFAIYEDRMVVTNKRDLGEAVLDRLLDGGSSLADNERFQAANKGVSDSATVWAFVDIAVIRDSGVADNVYSDQIDNPVLELLLGGIQSSLNETPYATAALVAKTDRMAMQFSMPHQADWIPEKREYYFGPGGQGRGPAVPEMDGTLFTLSTYRDFSEMWLRAGDLFGPETNDGFAQADANLTTLFAGRDFGEDILGSFQPEVSLIATRQDFADVLPKPTIKVPAFAAVFELREPESMTRELRRIFQSLVGFLNVVGAMNGQNQLELDMEKLEGDVELISSSFVPEEDDRESTQAKIIFNFSPTVGFDGSRFVVSSTTALARDLIATKPATQTDTNENTKAVLQADALRDVLQDNRGQLIAQNMLEDGNSREEAEGIIDLLLEGVGFFRDATFKLATPEDRMEIEFQIRLKQE